MKIAIKMAKGRLLLVVALGFVQGLILSAFAQPTRDFNEILQLPMYFSEVNPENPIGIFSLDLPFYFSDYKPVKHQLSVAFSMGNIWHPQAYFYYPQNLTQEQKNDVRGIFMTNRLAYFEQMGIETKMKTFGSDGVLEHLKFSYLTNWNGRNSLILNFNLHQLVGGQSWINYPVSDRFIEFIHTTFGSEDTFGRKLFPYNLASIEIEDENGNSFHKDKGDVFLSVLDGHYYRQLYHFKSYFWHLDAQVAAHLSVPLNQIHPYLVPGVSVGFRTDLRILRKSSFTLAANAGITDQSLIKVGKGVNAIDWRYRKNAQTFGSLNFLSKKRNVLTMGILLNYQDPLLKGYYFTRSETGYNEIGIKYLKKGDIWEGEPVSRVFRLAKLSPASLYYFSIRTCFIIGFKKNNGNEFVISAGQDNFAVNNAPDIQYSFQYRFSPFGKTNDKLWSSKFNSK